VAPATVEDPLNNYNVVTTQSDAGREILDAPLNYQNGDAAGPDITVTVYPSTNYVLPAPTAALVLSHVATWIGYADRISSANGGGSSLAQIGFDDEVYNTVSGGQYYRSITPFIQFYPGPSKALTGMMISPNDPVSLELSYGGPSTFVYTIRDPGAAGSTSKSGFVDLPEDKDSACAAGTSGSGTLITVCNNGDLAEWFVEDKGDPVNSHTNQVPPETPAFQKILFQQPAVTWNNGDSEIPNNSAWAFDGSDCPFFFGQAELLDTAAGGETLTLIPEWTSNNQYSADGLVVQYSGPPAPGFNWPS